MRAALWAGQFIEVRGAPPDYPTTGEACTSGFAVRKGSSRWLLTAQHCLAENRIVNIWKPTKPTMTTRYAGPISCGGGLLIGCLPAAYQPVDLPSATQKVKAWPRGDYLAWQPDVRTYQPEARVTTGRGTLPVLGVVRPRRDDRVCHYGAGSRGEVCGNYVNTAPNGWYGISIKRAIVGDSGGPAYTYVTDRRGRTIGVNAVGLVEVDFYADDKGRAKAGMSVAPIGLIEQELGVTLLTGS